MTSAPPSTHQSYHFTLVCITRLGTFWAHHPTRDVGTRVVPAIASAGFLKADLVRKNLSDNDLAMLKNSTTHVGGCGVVPDVWRVDWNADCVQTRIKCHTFIIAWRKQGRTKKKKLLQITCSLLAVDVHGRP